MKLSQAHDEEEGVLPHHDMASDEQSLGNKPESYLETAP